MTVLKLIMENWFKHDANAHADAKLMQLLMHSKSYYANYFLTLEWLFLMDDATASEKELNGLAYFLHESKSETDAFLKLCIELELFVLDSNKFYSPRLREQKVLQNEKSASAKAKAEKRWNKKNATAMPQHSHSNAEEKRREENNKPKGLSIVANATDDDRAIANELLDALLNSNESMRRKFAGDENGLRKKAGGFAEDIEKLRRIDKMPPEKIRMMIEWLFNSKHKDAIFWRGNIQSGKALREKFPRLIAAMEREHQDSKSSFLFIS